MLKKRQKKTHNDEVKATDKRKKALEELKQKRQDHMEKRDQEAEDECASSRAESDLVKLTAVHEDAETREKCADETRRQAEKSLKEMEGIHQTSVEMNNSAKKALSIAREALDSATEMCMVAKSNNQKHRTASLIGRQRFANAQQAEEGWRARWEGDFHDEADHWRTHRSAVALRKGAEDSLASSVTQYQAADKDVREKEDSAARYLAWEASETFLQSTRSLTLPYFLSKRISYHEKCSTLGSARSRSTGLLRPTRIGCPRAEPILPPGFYR